MDPVEILNRDCWIKLLEYVEEPLDKLNLVKTSSQLENLFHGEVVDWHFAAVIPIVFKVLEKIPLSEYQKETRRLISNPDKGLQSSFLACRLVSQSCSKEIIKYTEQYKKTFGYTAPYILKPYWPGEDNELIPRFLEDIEKDSQLALKIRSPLFLSGSAFIPLYGEVRTPLPDVPLPNPFKEDGETHTSKATILEFVEKVGNHLEILGVKVSTCDDEGVERGIPACDFLKNVIEQTPKLRYLNCELVNLCFEDFPEPEGLEPLILPDLPALECLNVIVHAKTYIEDRLNFRQYFNQLKVLGFGLSHWRSCYDNVEGLFPKLMSLTLYDVFLCEPYDQTKELMKLLEGIDAPLLEHLSLWVMVGPQDKNTKGELAVKTGCLKLLNQRYPSDDRDDGDDDDGGSNWKCAVTDLGQNSMSADHMEMKFLKDENKDDALLITSMQEEFLPWMRWPRQLRYRDRAQRSSN